MHIDTGNFEGHRSVIAMSWPCLLMLLVLGITGNFWKVSQSGVGSHKKPIPKLNVLLYTH